jgi:hypothetical protein
MPEFDVTIVGKAFLPEVGGGPIVPGAPPPGIWPSPGVPAHPIVIVPPDSVSPGVPTHPIYIPVFPAHPIVIPPGAIAPGVPEHPIYLPPSIWPSPGHPAHPIVIPPDAISPGVPSHPIVLPPAPPEVWPGPGQPAHPIVLPPEERAKLVVWTTGWSETTGWVIVGVPTFPVPSPAATTPPRR